MSAIDWQALAVSGLFRQRKRDFLKSFNDLNMQIIHFLKVR